MQQQAGSGKTRAEGEMVGIAPAAKPALAPRCRWRGRLAAPVFERPGRASEAAALPDRSMISF
jgi:hypothetical protein